MNQLARIEELFQPVFDSFQVILYECKWLNENKASILQVSIMFPDGSMDIETCGKVSEALSEILDQDESLQKEYFLEVCSPGAERILKNDQEILGVIGRHVFIQLKQPYRSMDCIKGDLLAFEQQELTISYRDKALTKKCVLARDNITLIRLAVKL